jgi:hypothetical protein
MEEVNLCDVQGTDHVLCKYFGVAGLVVSASESEHGRLAKQILLAIVLVAVQQTECASDNDKPRIESATIIIGSWWFCFEKVAKV